MSYRIDILLSTYNGARFLLEQLASIAAQDMKLWRLIARDDGSTDNSIVLLEAFAAKFPEQVILINEPSERMGIVASYEILLSKSDAEYVAFCDQDDVWIPGKLTILMQRMLKLEHANKPETAILVHSDLTVVDEKLEKIADSFWHYQKLAPKKMQSLERLLVQNCVTGCAALINRSLRDQVLPMPIEGVMHDWWIALVATSIGKIDAVDDKTVLYRQHASNDIGANQWSLRLSLPELMKKHKNYQENMVKKCNQAKLLLELGKLNNKQAECVSQFVDLPDQGWLKRRLTIFRMGFYKYGVIRNIAQFLWV